METSRIQSVSVIGKVLDTVRIGEHRKALFSARRTDGVHGCLRLQNERRRNACAAAVVDK